MIENRKQQSPRLLTVILNYRTAETTVQAAAAAYEALQGIPGEIVIVDNDSQDGSYQQLSDTVAEQGWQNIRVVQSGHNGGFGAGNNFGIRCGLSDGSAPDYIYILNSDAFPAKDAIRQLYDYLQCTPAADFAGSYIHGPDGSPHETAFRFPSILSELDQGANFGPLHRLLKNHITVIDIPTKPQKVDWLAGASVMMRQKALDQIGLFDESFFLYFEETDLCRRLSQAGGEVHYVPASKVAHIGSLSTGMQNWQRVPDYWFQSRFYYFAKTHGRLYAALALLAHVTAGLIPRLRALLGGRKDRVLYRSFLRDLLRHDLPALWRPLKVQKNRIAKKNRPSN